MQYIGLGVEIAAALSVPMLIGYWADGKFNTSPYLMLVGIGIGLLMLIGMFLRIIRNLNNDN